MRNVNESKKVSSILIEFNGLPGSGKSTVCKELEKIIRSNHISVCDYATYYKEISTVAFWRTKLLAGELKYGIFRICFYFIGLFISIPKKTLFDFKYCIFICMNYLAIRRLQRQNVADIIVSDEGVMQYMFSCFYDRKISNKYFIQKILKYAEHDLYGFVIVNVMLDNLQIIKRIQSRPNGMSRLDKEAPEILMRILKVQRDNLNIIRECGRHINSFTFLTEKDPEIVANNIWKTIGTINI